MIRNLIDLDLSDDVLKEIDAALAALDTALAGLTALDPAARRQLTKMGEQSEAFCRQAVIAFSQNQDMMPRNFDIELYRRDLEMLDRLRPRLLRFRRLHERLTDTETALGSDLMTNSLAGYAVLKVSGKGAGLDGLKQKMSARFNRRRRGSGGSASPPPESA